MNVDDVRRLALALPRTSEEPHHRMSSFRVDGKIFVTVPPGGDAVHIFVGEHEARAAVAESPERVELLWWGKSLSGVRVALADEDALGALVAELVEAAWRRKAPRRLIADHDVTPP